MKILYIAPRYHTNQIPVMAGWMQHGHRVLFVSQITNASENHEVLQPIVLGYSRIFELFFQLENKIKKRTLPDELFAVSSKRGFPPYFELRKIVKEFMPDVVILRERSLYTAVAYHFCKRFHIPGILYNQSPYWDVKNTKKDSLKKLLQDFFPKVRMTPVFGFPGEGKSHDEGAYYVPFVMEPQCSVYEKAHFVDNKVQIVCVAGYHDRKRLPLLIEAIGQLKEKYSVHLCIVGEVITDDQKQYYGDMVRYVEKLQLQETVTLLKNYRREQVFEQYKNSDLFVLPSTRERASISQLEAMSCALPIICSDTNGAACQVEVGVNGYLFQDESLEDLSDKIELAIKNREALVKMGQAGYELVCSQYSFEIYYQGISQILEDIRESDK